MLKQHEPKLTGFIVRPYRMKRLSEYCKRMSQDDTKIQYDDNVANVLISQGFSIEESPRSVYKVDKLYQALQEFAPGRIPKLEDSDHLTHGIKLAYSCFAKPFELPHLKALSLTPADIVLMTSNPTGSAGLTAYGCSKQDAAVRAENRAIQTLRKEKQPEPCLAFKRTQFNDKTRLVWGYPYSMTCIEGMLAYPLIQMFKKGFSPMSFAETTLHLGTKMRVSSYHKEWAYSLDMSQFDATISSKLIHVAFNVLRTWFDLSQVEERTKCTLKEVFDLVEYYFIHTTIVMPDSHIYIGKSHGVPSGSYFTQMIDSIVNVIIAGTISSKFNLYVDKDDIFVLGDDLLMWSNRKVDLDMIADFVQSNLFVKLHGSDKSAIYHFDDVIHYLGRDWENGVPTIPEEEILKRMVYPEKFRKYSSDPAERAREVRLLIASYAAVYRSGWRIATRAYSTDRRNYDQGSNCFDVNTYWSGRDGPVNPEHLSGLERYIRKYVWDRDHHGMPTTPTQFWLIFSL